MPFAHFPLDPPAPFAGLLCDGLAEAPGLPEAVAEADPLCLPGAVAEGESEGDGVTGADGSGEGLPRAAAGSGVDASRAATDARTAAVWADCLLGPPPPKSHARSISTARPPPRMKNLRRQYASRPSGSS